MTSCTICLNWTRKSNFQISRWTFHLATNSATPQLYSLILKSIKNWLETDWKWIGNWLETDWEWIPWGPAVKLLWNCRFALPRTKNLSGKLQQFGAQKLKESHDPDIEWKNELLTCFLLLLDTFYLWLLPWGLPDIPELWDWVIWAFWDEREEKILEIKVFFQHYKDLCTIISCQMELLSSPWWAQEASGVGSTVNICFSSGASFEAV